MAAQDRGHTRLGDCDADFLELTRDAEVAPARVLPCQANDQLDCLMGQGRAAVASMGIGPPSSYEGTMPAKDRLGCDEEGRPPFTRDEASEDTDDRSIRPGEAGTSGLALEHGELVAEHEDLGVLGLKGPNSRTRVPSSPRIAGPQLQLHIRDVTGSAGTHRWPAWRRQRSILDRTERPVSQAARLYSWMMPPRTSRRMTLPLPVIEVAGWGSGGSSSRLRCGLASL
jgi:hypothetical protein